MDNQDKITKAIIADMLRENTGRSFLDSGGTPQYDENGCYIGSTGGYGRAWERNRCVKFELQPDLSYQFRTYGSRWEMSATKSIYHFLVNNFTYAEDWQQIFDDFCETTDESASWLQCMYLFGDWLKEIYGEIGFGIYGELPEPTAEYTYNRENVLSQDIQYMEISIPEEGDDIVLIQVHGGCDAFSY